MDLFNLIRASNPTKVKTGSRPRAPHEVPLLTLTATRVIEMDDLAAATDSSGVPSRIERSLLDFALEARASEQGTVALEMSPSEDVPVIDVPGAGQAEETVATDPPTAPESRKRGRDGTNVNAPPKSSQGTAAAGDPESENASSPVEVGSPESIYRPEWGVANGSILDTPEACQDLVDHVAPPGYFSELRHMHNEEFLRQYNVNLARQVAMGSQLRLRIQARELEIKNLEARLETEADMKKAAEDKNAGLIQELEDIRARFSDLQVSSEHLSQKVATLQEQVSGEGKLKAAFEEFKRYKDDRVEQRCAELDARLDALSIDFDEELYPHMLTAIGSRRQAFADVVSAGIAKGMSEGLRHEVEHGQTKLNVESIEAYDPEAEAKFVAALQALKDLKYPSSQLTIPVYQEVRDPRNPWAYKEEMLLADAIATNISRAEKKKKCRIVCGTHGVGSAHHAWSDGVPVSMPTVVP
uniref:Transposase (Putative), gypsy type n=1 Tax=Tanacetum cinerariifolium TaxID=118510 RepID=A0A6L2P4A5_TANCI|nr:hypothetical protein [Tanacetum cinerariifolium]